MIVMEPIKGGALANLPSDVEAMFKVLRTNDSISLWALRYVGTLPNVKVILSGVSTLENVCDNLKTFKQFEVLSNNELELVDKVVK